MFLIGELVHIFHGGSVLSENIPCSSNKTLNMRYGGTRNVHFKLIHHHRSEPKCVLLMATVSDCDEDEIVSGRISITQGDGRKSMEHDAILIAQESGHLTFDIYKRYIEENSVVKVYIQILSEKALYANLEAERKMEIENASALGRYLIAVRKHNELMPDVRVVAQGVPFPAHISVLSASSEVFGAMFRHDDTLESQEKKIDVTDVDPTTMEMMLIYIYESTLPKDLSFESLAELLGAADKYQIQSLVDSCVGKMRQILNADNAVQAAILGDTYRSKELREAAIEAIANSDTTLGSMTGCNQLRNHYPELLWEIFAFLQRDRQQASKRREF